MSCRSGIFICRRSRTFNLTLIQWWLLSFMANIHSHQTWRCSCKYFKALLVGGLLLFFYSKWVKGSVNATGPQRAFLSGNQIKWQQFYAVSEQALQINKQINKLNSTVCASAAGLLRTQNSQCAADVALSNCNKSWPYFWPTDNFIFKLLSKLRQLCTHKSFYVPEETLSKDWANNLSAFQLNIKYWWFFPL